MMSKNFCTGTYKKHRFSLPIRLFVPDGTAGFDGMPKLGPDFLESLGGLLRENSPELIKNRCQELLLSLWRMWVQYLWSRQTTNGTSLLPVLRNSYKKNLYEKKDLGPCGETTPESEHNPDGWERPAVLYDRHGALDHEVHMGPNQKPTGLKPQVLFWSPYRGEHSETQLFENPPRESFSKVVLVHQFLESGLTRVAVLDERVQSTVMDAQKEKMETSGRNVSVLAILRDMRIWVPRKRECDLDYPEPQKIRRWLCEASEQCGGFDFLVVHQGVLDKLTRHLDGESPGAWIQGLTDACGIADLVVCSGRGVPSGMLPGARFVPLSSLLRWIVRDRSKYYLCQLLFSSRRPSHV